MHILRALEDKGPLLLLGECHQRRSFRGRKLSKFFFGAINAQSAQDSQPCLTNAIWPFENEDQRVFTIERDERLWSVYLLTKGA